MSQEFDAVYERGVFRPLQHVDLPDQTKVHLQVQEADRAASPTMSKDELRASENGDARAS